MINSTIYEIYENNRDILFKHNNVFTYKTLKMVDVKL